MRLRAFSPAALKGVVLFVLYTNFAAKSLGSKMFSGVLGVFSDFEIELNKVYFSFFR